MLLQQLTQIHQNLASKGFEMEPLVFEPVATEEQIASVEASLGMALPPSFRRVLLGVSSHVEFSWFCPDDAKFSSPFDEIFSGNLYWSLDSLVEFEQVRESWQTTCFPNRNDPYDVVWWEKLAFLEVGNGDQIAIDLKADSYEQIVYLSHDDGEGHGHVLAKDFEDLLRRWAPLGCPGAEDWQWLPFTNNRTSPIDPECQYAGKWKTLISLS